MNEHVSSLYVRAHELLNLGMDGSPIYSDHFARLNREVYEQALDLYNTLEGNTPEEEAELCLSILVALNATFYDNGRKQQYIQRLLDRCLNVLDKLPDSLLKVRLLTCCYGEVYEEKLAHTLNNTVVAPPRMLIAFLENNLNADGTVSIPEVLRMYMGGKEKLVPKH